MLVANTKLDSILFAYSGFLLIYSFFIEVKSIYNSHSELINALGFNEKMQLFV